MTSQAKELVSILEHASNTISIIITWKIEDNDS